MAPERSPDIRQPDIQDRAIAFLDCCGYSAYTRLHGDLAAVDIHLRMRDTVEREAAAAQVAVVKWMGDGAMLAAEACDPILACVYRAMVCARDAELLPLRAGMASGPVAAMTHGTVDYFGACVNRAARLCSAADPWQLRVENGPNRDMMHFTLLSARAPGTRRGALAAPVRREPVAAGRS